jgi:hypothetical protein
MLGDDKKLKIKSFFKKPFVKYLIVACIILLSNLVWYNFLKPPISANTGFPINMLRYVRYFYLPFNFYSWPVSYNQMVNFLPGTLPYFLLNAIDFGNYSVSYFIYNVGFEIAGGFSLFYLSSKFFTRYGINDSYSILSVLVYAFNVSVLLDGAFESGTAEILIVLALLYLILYRSRIYVLLLGFLSFFIFYPFPGGYPDGATILLEEFIIICVILFLRELFVRKQLQLKGAMPRIKWILVSVGTVALSLSYIFFIIFSSGSTLIANSVSFHPAYVFAFIYDWIAVLPNSMRLILNWGIYTVYAGPWVRSYLANPIISILLYILPFFSLASILFLKKRDYYIYILLIISIFAATASNPPLGKIFEYLILYVGPLRVFYESDAYYPILVIFYAVLFPLTLYNFNEIIKKYGAHEMIPNKKRWKLKLNYNRHKIFTALIVLILLATVFPIYTGLVDESGSAMPVESSIPGYYNQASNFLALKDKNSPVMVFPGIYGFSAYETGGKIWYQGIDLYPGLINNPSVSDDISGSYTVGRGNAYSVISYIYGSPMSTVYGSSQNDSKITSSDNYIVSNTSLIKWLADYSSDRVNFVKSSNSTENSVFLNYYVNASIYNNSIGLHDLIGYFGRSFDISKYDYIILDMKANVPTSSFSLGFMNSSGDFFYWTSVNNFLPTITPKTASVVPVYLGSTNAFYKQNITAMALSYNSQEGNPSSFNVSLYSLRFGNSSVNPAAIISRGLNVLGVRYVYVDTGIVDPYGRYNGIAYNSIFENSSLFNRIYTEGTVSIYSYTGYGGLFQAYSRVTSYSSETSLLGDLFYNISSEPMPLYGMNVSNFKILSTSSITGFTEISPTEFDVKVNYNGPFALFFKEGFNSNWVALNATGVPIKNHFEADGFGNGWIISHNTSSIKIVYKGALAYAGLVTVTVVIPFAMLASFAVLCIVKRSKREGRRL